MISMAVWFYGIMALFAFVISFKSYGSYKRTRDDALRYFSLAFLFFGLYLLSIPILLVFSVGPSFFAKTMALSRNFVILSILFLLQTSIFKSFNFFRKYNIFIVLIISILSILTTIQRFYTAESLSISDIGIVVFSMDLFSGIVVAFLSLFIGVSWATLLLRRIPYAASTFFKLKVYVLSYGAVVLALGDAIYVLAKTIPQSIIGSSIAMLGYFMIVVSVMLPDIRKLILRK